MSDDPYSRIYHRLCKEYPAVWKDAALLGTFGQLLIVADQAYPGDAYVPPFVDVQVLARLVKTTDLVEVDEDGYTYRLRGLEKERKRRARRARKAARVRWDRESADEDADALASIGANARAMQVQCLDETRREETSREKTRKERVKDPKRNRLEPIADVLGVAR